MIYVKVKYSIYYFSRHFNTILLVVKILFKNLNNNNAYQIQGSCLHPASLGHNLKNKVQYISQSSINRRTLTGVTPKWLKCLGWVIFGWIFFKGPKWPTQKTE